MNIDLLADNYYSFSTYSYCINNPVILFDPIGMDVYFDYDGNFLYDDGEGDDFRLIDAVTFNEIHGSAKDEAKEKEVKR